MTGTRFEIRRADPSDVEAIAAAHLDSIRAIGSTAYPPEVVDDWAAGLNRELYLEAMRAGEVFFVATGDIDNRAIVLGFSSDYVIEGAAHGTSVYVRGVAARQGIGSALLRAAEARALETGATSIQIEASLASVAFYSANGFIEIGRGETRLTSGRPIACVSMRKALRQDTQ